MQEQGAVGALSEAELTFVRATLERVVARLAPGSPERVEPSQSLIDELGFDSFRLVELAVRLEELFDVEFMTFEAASLIGTVEDLGGFVVRRIAEAAAVVPSPAQVEQMLRTL
ncbi:acyl carrier protein [Actinospica robiniae]|uniref:acyl carrier protein n=1 Tax=Actinospica robiniae TaxID=304901 RepID=UPI0004229A2B|nr:acyl carrier protein [Actinospica robiniae]